MLKREIKALADDVTSGRLLAPPATAREDWMDRVRALYGFDDADEFTAARVRRS
jgi:hypothetical protein